MEKITENIVGSRYGRWTVLEYAGKGHNGEYYKCKCDCGTVRTVLKRSLIRGVSKSCGCLKRDRLQGMVGEKHTNFSDITGKRFGRLVALGDSGERNSYGGVIWKCRCDCGNIVNVSLGSLRSGRTKSCGCYKKSGEPYKGKNLIDLAGKRFGRLTVIEKTDEFATDGCAKWRCRCDCGKETVVSSHYLISGTTQSCGCRREENRLAACKSEECIGKHRIISTEKWSESAEKIGMQDGTNISIIKSKNARVDSTTGVRGVFKKRNSYVATLTFQGKKYNQYGFASIESAAKAREKMYEEIVLPYLESVGKV